jgi:hypothetical protein
MLIAWVRFHDLEEENRAVAFRPGSHRWSATGLDFFSQDTEGLEASIVAQGLDPTPVAPRMLRGQVPPLPDGARQLGEPDYSAARWRFTCSRSTTGGGPAHRT